MKTLMPVWEISASIYLKTKIIFDENTNYVYDKFHIFKGYI